MSPMYLNMFTEGTYQEKFGRDDYIRYFYVNSFQIEQMV